MIFAELRGVQIANLSWSGDNTSRNTLSQELIETIDMRLHESHPYRCRTCRRYHGTVGTRERKLLALPTLDMYLPLSKFESIHRVYIALRCNHKCYETLS